MSASSDSDEVARLPEPHPLGAGEYNTAVSYCPLCAGSAGIMSGGNTAKALLGGVVSRCDDEEYGGLHAAFFSTG